jgi:hypothetical protein
MSTPGAEHSHRFAFCVHGAAMRRSIHAASQAAENDQAAVREIARQPLGHAQSVRCGMARAYDGNPRLGYGIHISAHIKVERRIVDLL